MKTSVLGHLRYDQQMLIDNLGKTYLGQTEEAVRKDLEEKYDAVWNDEELLADFGVQFFDAPIVRVIRCADGVRGTVAFIDTPRLYFAFMPDTEAAK
jgi:hypothetical protein